MSRSRVWAWTINARAEYPHEVPIPPGVAIGRDNVLYYKYQLERGEDDHRLHLQGCMRFSQPKSLAQVKTILGCAWAHCEVAREWKKLVDYCGKEETRAGPTVEEGDVGEQGKRSDLKDVAEAVAKGMGVDEVAIAYGTAFIKFHKGIEALHHRLHPPLYRENLKVFCLYGPTGVGKTHFIHKYFPGHYSMSNMKVPWMCGYNQEKVVLMDDYGPKMMDINYLKKVLDKYKCTVPVKGGHVAWNPETIFITTNHLMATWWDGGSVGDHDIGAISRRIIWITLTGDRDVNERLICDTVNGHGVLTPGRPEAAPPAAQVAVAADGPVRHGSLYAVTEIVEDLTEGADLSLQRDDAIHDITVDRMLAMMDE